MTKPDYSNKEKLIEYYSNLYKDDYSFVQFMSERLDYFSDRFTKEHIEFFDLLWKKCKERLRGIK